jgi:hypothetical protein
MPRLISNKVAFRIGKFPTFQIENLHTGQPQARVIARRNAQTIISRPPVCHEAGAPLKRVAYFAGVCLQRVKGK